MINYGALTGLCVCFRRIMKKSLSSFNGLNTSSVQTLWQCVNTAGKRHTFRMDENNYSASRPGSVQGKRRERNARTAPAAPL